MPAKTKKAAAATHSAARTPRVVIDLTVEHLFTKQKAGVTRCVCCPSGVHVFGAGATITACAPDIRSPYEHHRDLSGTLSSFFFEHGRHGKRVRVTVEELPDA